MKNPKQISWADPTTYEDGSAFLATDFKAYELGHSTTKTAPANALLALPVAFGVGKSPIPDQVKGTLGISYIFLRTIDQAGQISDWSLPVEVQFTGRPLAPKSVITS